MKKRLRIFVSSPGDVMSAREIAALTIERLAQDYARFLEIEPYLWEFEAMVASGHFQDSIEPPSAFDVVVLILWSRLGTHLPERTAVREYRGIDGRAPLTGTEWEFEEAFQAAKRTGAPDLLVYRDLRPALFDTHDPGRFEQQSQQLKALNGFWERHFANQGMFIGAYSSFTRNAEFAAALENHLRKLIEKRIDALHLAQGDTATKPWVQAPFRGLEAYEFEHAPIFFGQDEALAKAMLQLTANALAGFPFLLVLGASGSGKSSLVKAGIVPKLFVPRRISGSAFLRFVIFRPSDAQDGEDLFDALARRLTTRASEHEGLSELIDHGQSIASLSAHLRNATAAPAYPIETALGQLTARARQSGRMLEYETARLVLVVDQLEELFTDERLPTDEHRRFIDLLAGLLRSGLVWIVATMRKDFWHRADDTPELVRLAEGNGRLELLPPLPSQLSQMIRRPAEAVGIHFEMHGTTNVPLNEVISEEVAREPGALPLLSYLLDQLYRIDVLETQGSTLTFASYERLGKLEGAVATQAEAVLERCAPEDRAALGSVMFSLVDMGTAEGNVERAIARRVPLSTFQPGTSQRRLVEALLDPDARLLVSGTETGGAPTVRVAHEALITRWAQARDFVQSNAEALKIRHRIEERYALWRPLRDGTQALNPVPMRARLSPWRSRFGREQGMLTDIDLIDGRRLLKEHRMDTEPHLVAYIERSIADNNRIRTRTVRVLTVFASVVTLLAIAASAAGWMASKRQREAEYQTTQTLQAQARLLTEVAAQRLSKGDVAGASSIILEVLPKYQFSAAVNVFQESRAMQSLFAVLSGHTDLLKSVAFSPDGSQIVSASNDHTARIWDSRSGILVAVLDGHKDIVFSANYARDGRRIVTASKDKTARIWDARTGVTLAILSSHTNAVYAANFSPNGARVVTASFDNTARIWDAYTGTELHVLTGHSDHVESATYSPDGRLIVTCAKDNTAKIWYADTGLLLATLSGHKDTVWKAFFSPDGTLVVTASKDGTARIWDATTGRLISILSGHMDNVFSARYSPDGSRIATAGGDKTARVWNARTGFEMTVLRGHTDGLTDLAFSPNGKQLLTSSFDNTARLWDTSTGRPLGVFAGHSDAVTSVAFSPDGAKISTGSADQTVRIWDSGLVNEITLLSNHNNVVMSAGFSPDDTRIVTASYDQTARIWDAHSGEQLEELRGHTDWVNSAIYSPDGLHVVTASTDHTARIWDSRTGKQDMKLRGHTDIVLSAAYSRDGLHIVTASADRSARIWDTRTGTELNVLVGHDDALQSAEYSPDGTRIVTTSVDKTARIWDARTGSQLIKLSGHNDEVITASYSPDGNRIVTASADKTARIWDARTGSQLMLLAGHEDKVETAAFSPDGVHVVTAGDDKTVRIWDAAIGTQLAVLVGHTDKVESASYSHDGLHIVSASDDKTVRVWKTPVLTGIAEQILWAQATETRTLSEFELGQLGLPKRNNSIGAHGTDCDRAAGAIYDPLRRAPGIEQQSIVADLAYPVCVQEIAKSDKNGRTIYQLGRALLAKRDQSGAQRQFERAVAEGYSAAAVDLGALLAAKAGRSSVNQAITEYERAWNDGISFAAYELGQFYEHGAVSGKASEDEARIAWAWYQKGAEVGEPHSLARFAERDEVEALSKNASTEANVLLLRAFSFYAAAAERAGNEAWPDNASEHWRYRRATLARLLAREGMMQQVADTYRTVREKWAPQPPTTWQVIKTKFHR